MIDWIFKILGIKYSYTPIVKDKIKRDRISEDAIDMVKFYYIGNDGESNLTQKEIAYMVGISPASVSRIINKYKKDNNV